MTVVDYLPGADITTDERADVLVNTVNCVGVMGKGVALAFRTRWPSIMGPYREACRSGRLRPGGCLLLPLERDGFGSKPESRFKLLNQSKIQISGDSTRNHLALAGGRHWAASENT